ncbi:MAG: transglutaminase family protein [Candidatus Lokiarchaeota archaeon]|nr:transglutaminase family protein [Candidatus Lokiarchaeota archaeon]
MLLEDLSVYLEPTYFIDSDSEYIKNLAQKITQNAKNKKKKAIKIFYWTRDTIYYDPYESFASRKSWYKASNTAKRGKGWCVQKAVVLTALGRALGIPSRLHFADIRNYKISEKQKNIMHTDVFIYHGFTELFMDGKWVKLTPAFNKELCIKFSLPIVEFDGTNDAILSAYTLNGEKYIEYLADRGPEIDLPFKRIFKAFFEYYV